MCDPKTFNSNSVWRPSFHWHPNILHGDPFHFSVKFYWGFHQKSNNEWTLQDLIFNWLFKIRKQSIIHNMHKFFSSHLKFLMSYGQIRLKTFPKSSAELSLYPFLTQFNAHRICASSTKRWLKNDGNSSADVVWDEHGTSSVAIIAAFPQPYKQKRCKNHTTKKSSEFSHILISR